MTILVDKEAIVFFSFFVVSGDPVEEFDKYKEIAPEPCIALHIRRGDASIDTNRECFSYDIYIVQFNSCYSVIHTSSSS